MKIDRIDAVPFTIPYRREVRFATGSLSAADHVLLRVMDSDGAIGSAEVIPRPMIYGETVGSVLAAVESVVRPLLCGQDVGPGHDLRHRLVNLVGNNTLKGGLDIALWDLLARRYGVPCWQVLGGDGGSSGVAVTAILGVGEPAKVVDEATGLAESHGFRSFKIKVGMAVERDVATCVAMRAAFPHAVLYVDANHGFSSQQAMAFTARVEELDLAWVEEPVDGAGVAGRRRVVESSRRPVLGDESVPDARSVARELTAGRCDMVSIKIARTGFTESAQILGVCAALGCDAVLGSQGDSELGTLASLQFAGVSPAIRIHPAELSYFATALSGGLLTEPLVIRDGRMSVPAGPGIGGEIDEGALCAYAS